MFMEGSLRKKRVEEGRPSPSGQAHMRGAGEQTSSRAVRGSGKWGEELWRHRLDCFPLWVQWEGGAEVAESEAWRGARCVAEKRSKKGKSTMGQA